MPFQYFFISGSVSLLHLHLVSINLSIVSSKYLLLTAFTLVSCNSVLDGSLFKAAHFDILSAKLALDVREVEYSEKVGEGW